MKKVSVGKGLLSATFDVPYLDDSFNRGTRFDRCGVFTSLKFDGKEMCGEWFEKRNPLAHDCVCGPSEEFITAGYEETPVNGSFVKIGVGRLLKKDDSPYDRFKLYEIADPGVMEIEKEDDRVCFRHTLDGAYSYSKTIAFEEDGSMLISHRLENTGDSPVRTHVYNHNFFTLGRFTVDSGRAMDLNFAPCGHWREIRENVSATPDGFRFSAPMVKERGTAFMGDVHAASQESPEGLKPLDGFKACVSDSGTGLAVRIMPQCPVEFSVFWSNHRICCIEPYTPLDIKPGGAYEWSIRYWFFYL